MDELLSYWETATSFADPDIANKWWQLIVKHYSEGRTYHNVDYLKTLFKFYNEYKEKFAFPEAIILAIFFHKLEFCPKSGHGELKSLEKFQEFTKETTCDESDLYKSVCVLLEGTLKNLTEAHMEEGAMGCDAEHFFLDFIMAPLGTPLEEYENYALKVRDEYSHLSAKEYTKLRLKTLKCLLLIPNLFATKEFRSSLEESAKKNIKHEISKLEGEQVLWSTELKIALDIFISFVLISALGIASKLLHYWGSFFKYKTNSFELEFKLE